MSLSPGGVNGATKLRGKFADLAERCENACPMKNTIKIAVMVVAMSSFMAAGARGQQSGASGSQQAPTATPTKLAAKPAPNPAQAATSAKPDTLELKTDKDKASYALGMNIGEGLKRQADELDSTIVQRAMQDALTGNKLLMTDEEAKTAWMTFQVSMRKKAEEQAQQAAAENKKQGEDFLTTNKTKEGVVALPSGLQYKILTAGTGPKPTATDSVVCNYKGTLLNGTEFDSSYKRGQPATFPVTGVIKGWTEALQLMPVGSKWELFVPSDLAYGARGAGNGSGIGPNSTLIFEVELISINSSEPAKDANKPADPGAEPTAAKPDATKDPSKDPSKDK